MDEILRFTKRYWKALLVSAGMAALYPLVFVKLGRDLWAEENYSHGLLVPFVVGFILWSERESLRKVSLAPLTWSGAAAMTAAAVMLIAGTLGAELFTQRISFVLMSAGMVLYFFGRRMLQALVVPFGLMLLAIPIPQIVFNSIALPLQILASKLAVLAIRVIGVPSLRNGNVIDILPFGATQSVSLEVVEACSGIRSLMTLVTLALVLVYFTRNDSMGRGGRISDLFRSRDIQRAFLLMLSAVPVAVVTNAARVAITGYLTYRIGKQSAEGALHEALGYSVYLISLGLLIAINSFVRKKLSSRTGTTVDESTSAQRSVAQHIAASSARFATVIAIIVFSAATVNWLGMRGEARVERRPLAELPSTLGEWRQKGVETRFDKQTESVLRATDYTMRDYLLNGRSANVYVGYYESQKSGATYHSPKNCLPGSGWVMKEPELVEISTPSGKKLTVNRFIIESGSYRAVMLYWYQGRGRVESSEYTDKLNTIWDSFWKSRTDGAMVRVMTAVDSKNPEESHKSAENLAANLADQLGSFIPE